MEIFEKFIEALISKIEEEQIEGLDCCINRSGKITDVAKQEYTSLKETKDYLKSYIIDSEKLHDFLLEYEIIKDEEGESNEQ